MDRIIAELQCTLGNQPDVTTGGRRHLLPRGNVNEPAVEYQELLRLVPKYSKMVVRQMVEIAYRSDERLSSIEYISFLRTSDLGSMYPRKGFEERIDRLLANVDVTVTARARDKLVGVCMGITDFAYFLFLTDLGVSRAYERRGIGRSLVAKAHEAAGGAEDITVVTWANRKAMPMYASCGIVPHEGLIGKEATWELFDARDMTSKDT